MKALYFHGLVKSVQICQNRIQLNLPALSQIQSLYDQANAILASHPDLPVEMPARTLHAYRWVEVFSDPQEYERGVQTIQDYLNILSASEYQKKMFRKQIQVALENNGYLYQVRANDDKVDIHIHAAFSGAPRPVIEALAAASMGIRKKVSTLMIQEYSRSDHFQTLEMRLKKAVTISTQHGTTHDLLESFQRVNQKYFNNKLDQPNMVWMPRATYKRMGSYQQKSDILAISPTLDNENVPVEVFDYVMYHELLHKMLPPREVNGRNYAHTAEFRHLERMYPDYANINTWMNEYLARITPQYTPKPTRKRFHRKGT